MCLAAFFKGRDELIEKESFHPVKRISDVRSDRRRRGTCKSLGFRKALRLQKLARKVV